MRASIALAAFCARDSRHEVYALGPSCSCTSVCEILNPMVQYVRPHLNATFAALSDATRRGVLQQLGRGDASITSLAAIFRMTLTGMKKHVRVLEQAGLVRSEKVGRVRTCKLGPRRLEDEAAWLEGYRQVWAARFDALDEVLDQLTPKEQVDEHKADE